MSKSATDTRKLKVLVDIASFGDRQIEYLKRLIAAYQAMPLSIDIVVHSNAPKDLDKRVKVIVGLPSKNPRSLPFAHKTFFAENMDRYDLFIYTEDDVMVSADSIQAFMDVSRDLADDEIAGHLRYEMNPSGGMCLPDVHGNFHWKPESVKARNGHLVAEFTNAHAGFYMLTREQLKRAIASGGFLRAPYAGLYSMLETAATDPFTSCGFRKVICISQLDNFLLHHMPNKYAGRLGISREILDQQVAAMKSIQKGTHPAISLCESETKMPELSWSKDYYEAPQEDLTRLVPEKAKNILSLGCGWGATEALLKRDGTKVTALPVDSVIGAVAEQRGIEVIYGTLDEGLKKLAGRKFDCIVIADLLHLLPEQERIVQACHKLLEKGGTLLISGPNFGQLPTVIKRVAGKNEHRKLGSFKQSGINTFSPGALVSQARKAGFQTASVKWLNHALPGRRLAKVKMELGGITAKNWIVQARR